MSALQNVFAHLTIVFAGVFFTLLALNVFNPAMQFLSSLISQIFLLVFCCSALLLAVVTVVENRYHAQLASRREAPARRW